VLDVCDFPQVAAAMGADVNIRKSAPVAIHMSAGTNLIRPANGTAAPSPYSLPATDSSGHMRRLQEVESEMIRLAIARYEGHMSEVARRLGIGRSTLYRKLKDLGLEHHLSDVAPESEARQVVS